MRKKIIAGNWKMNGSMASVSALADDLREDASSISGCDIAVFPPFVFLEYIQRVLKDSPIRWGAQNLSENDAGAYTGEISAAMLVDFGCKYVLVGHSERRSLYGETNEIVAKKFEAATRAGLTPILCLGETLEQREMGQTFSVVKEQLKAVIMLQGVALLDKAVVAYEPVWAIGTGKTASSEQAQEVHKEIRNFIAEYDADIASAVQIIYGGSVKATNARELLAMPDIDGALVGGASLNVKEFMDICKCNN